MGTKMAEIFFANESVAQFCAVINLNLSGREDKQNILVCVALL